VAADHFQVEHPEGRNVGYRWYEVKGADAALRIRPLAVLHEVLPIRSRWWSAERG
jgi:hypothetical protein